MANTNGQGMSFLRTLLGGVKQLFVGGTPVQTPAGANPTTLNFASGATATYNPPTGSVDVVVTAATGVSALQTSIVDIMLSQAPTWTSAGNYSTGSVGMFSYGATIKGLRFYWPGNITGFPALASIKCSVWDMSTSTRLATVTVAVAAAGIYEALFAAPLTLTGAEIGHFLAFTMYETTGTYSVNCSVGVPTNDLGNLWPVLPFFGSSGFLWGNAVPALFAVYAGGDAVPTIQHNACFCIEPMMV